MPLALVTGVGGFLGGLIGEHLMRAGWQVQGMARTPRPAPYPVQALTLPADDLPARLAAFQPDLIVHAAGPASVGQSLQAPYADFVSGVGGWLCLLDAARQAAPRSHLVLLSSASVYGNPSRLPVAEDDPIAPISPYGHHKHMCEQAARYYQQLYGLRITVFRIFSAYGAGLRRQLLWDIAQKIRQGVVRLDGTGEETRDYVHGRDVAAAVAWCAAQPAAGFVLYNLASGQAQSVRDVAQRLIAHLAPGCPLVFSGVQRPGDPLYWQADIRRLQAAGFQPQIPFESGLADYAAWLQMEGA